MTNPILEKLKRSFNKEYADKFPFKLIEDELFLPINKQNNILFVAVANANDKERLEKVVTKIQEYSKSEVKVLPVNKSQFDELINDYKQHLNAEIDKLTSKPHTPVPALANKNNNNNNQQAQPQRKRLGDMLVEQGLITQEQLVEALAQSKRWGQPIGSVLVKSGVITVEQLREALSEQQGIGHVEADQLNVEKDVINLLPEDFIKSNKVIPVSTDGKNLVVGMVNPSDKIALNEIIYLTGLLPSPLLITHIEFERCIETFFKNQQRADKIIEAFSQEDLGETENLWEQVERELQDNSSAVAKFANQIITDAIDAKASDIHIEPRTGKYIVRYRVDGILKRVIDIPEKVESQVISRYKVISRMNIAEHRRAQDGTFSLKYNNISYDFRINTLPVGMKEKMVIRILQPSVNLSAESKEIKLVGASKSDIEKINLMTSVPNGIILTSGPTGSGKTTTLYSVLKKVNDESVNITTIEDPIEIRLEGINQTQVNPKADITFANCMRAILRQDPDIIMVGEIRDYETLEAAISAALTGHLVLSTIHTNSAAATVTRLIEMGARDYLIASSLAGVIAQRLVRRLCPHCKEKYKPTLEEAKMVVSQKEEIEAFLEREIYRPVGCERCRYDGFIGRLGVYEIMPVNREIKKLIAQSAPDVEIEEVAISCGMKTLTQSCLEHILNGETTIGEFVRVLGIVSE